MIDITTRRQINPSIDFVGMNEPSLFGCFRLRPYFRRRSNALEGIAVASFLGVSSGLYIWKPIFQEMEINRVERERRELEEGGGLNNGNKDS
jgi:hypothetical protein